ncbi:MAG: metallophosphoesterase family protein [Bacteroidota bacterium]
MKQFFLISNIIVMLCFSGFSQEGQYVSKVKRYGSRPALIRGPYLQAATSTSMVVRWRTDETDVSFVRYGTDMNKLDKLAGAGNQTREHIVTLAALEPQTKYYYLIEGLKDTLQFDASNNFVTLPPIGKEDKYRIGVFGDCGNNGTNQRNTRDQFEKYLGKDPLTAWILLGDNAYSFGTDMDYQSEFFNAYKDRLLKSSPLFPAPGNHDYKDESYVAEIAQRSGEIAYYQNFTMPTKGESGGVPSNTAAYYSFDIGNIHFLSLDSHGTEENGARLFDTSGKQVRWVKSDLEANRNKGWTVVYWHHAPYSMGSHNSDTEKQMVKIRENFIRILERYGVDLVLCGHSHSYERSKLMQGHYGMEETFSPDKHLLSQSSGFYDGSNNSCPYIKDSTGKGTVYVLSGSSGRVDGKQLSFPHDAMPFSDISTGGACILEVEANRLDLKWICADGSIRDRFTMMKAVNKKTIINSKQGEAVSLRASYIGKYKWEGMPQTERAVDVKPPVGISTYTVSDPYSCIKDTFEIHVSKK